ncbi:unnamed protein product [Arabis nemorensis]|uniref:Transmembrane protein n=1 Tax=Arabis nemorensis TaxID=586526 RepID=A0A565BC44_9BRAS|nr:unnamed protein product [Arabis nemorensis]
MVSHIISEIFPPLISILIVFVLIILDSSTKIINARELRPSDHGLEYNYEPSESSEMTSFFGPPSSNELTSTSSSSPSGSTLPSAVKSPLTSSKGSLVCALSGVVLMVASAIIYLNGYPKIQNSSSNSDQIIHNNAK